MVVLATKVSVSGDARERAIQSLTSLVQNSLGELDVDIKIGVRFDNFPTVTITGEDAVIARNVLREEWGEIKDDFTAGEIYVGTLESWDDDGFELDAGIPVHIPRNNLGLGQGTPRQIVERFGLVQHTPLQFVCADQPELASEERDRLFDWRRGNGRVNVNNVTRAELRATINRAGHAQDIVTIERLGLLEQSIICKEGTDPPGLLASIGRFLPAEMRCVIPR